MSIVPHHAQLIWCWRSELSPSCLCVRHFLPDPSHSPHTFLFSLFCRFTFAVIVSTLWTVFPARKVWAVPSFHRKIVNSGDLKGNTLTFPLTSYLGQIFSLQCISTSSSLSFSIFWNAVCFGRCTVQKGFSPSKYAVTCFVKLYKDSIQNAKKKKMQPWDLLSLRTHFQHLKQMVLNLFREVFRILKSNSWFQVHFWGAAFWDLHFYRWSRLQAWIDGAKIFWD